MTYSGHFPNSAGTTAPPMRPESIPSEQRPATRGDIAAVVDVLDDIRRLLVEIRDENRQSRT